MRYRYMTGLSGNIGRAVCAIGWELGIGEMDHDYLANTKKMLNRRRLCDTGIGSSHDKQSPFEIAASGTLWQRVGTGGYNIGVKRKQ